ncbi:MAG: hypothetical protein H0W84_12885 [Bacteroidetes bacterium]|nr:hypothetical protein [Bacteroidota bacterium]
MKKLLYLFLLISTTGFAQGNFKLITTIDIQADFFTTDNQSNVYVVKGDELCKYNKAGKQLYKYSNKKFGNISFVDASNMLRLLIFYKNFLQVVFLDNTLSVIGELVNLDKIGFQQAQLVCSSHNSGMWLYDQQNFELIRLDQTLEKKQQTGNLRAILNTSLQPDLLLEYDNKVYLNDTTKGILIFDIYGTYYKTVSVKNTKYFQPIGDWVYFMNGNKVKTYNLKTTEEKEFKMPVSDFKNFRLEMGILVLQTENTILLFSSE